MGGELVKVAQSFKVFFYLPFLWILLEKHIRSFSIIRRDRYDEKMHDRKSILFVHSAVPRPIFLIAFPVDISRETCEIVLDHFDRYH